MLNFVKYAEPGGAEKKIAALKDPDLIFALHRRMDVKKVISHVFTVTVGTLSPPANAYADGNVLEGKLTFANAARGSDAVGGIIRAVIITDKSGSAVANQVQYDLLLFDSDPSATTFTDKTLLTLNAADIVRMIGFVSINSWSPANSGGAVAIALPDLPYVIAPTTLSPLVQGTSLFGALLVRGGTPTYLGANDLQIRLVLAQD